MENESDPTAVGFCGADHAQEGLASSVRFGHYGQLLVVVAMSGKSCRGPSVCFGTGGVCGVIKTLHNG